MPGIIATISPKVCNPHSLKAFYLAGMSIARINASHSSLEEAEQMIKLIQTAISACPIMLDLPGPEYRVRGMACDLNVKKGNLLTIKSLPDSVKSESTDLHTEHPLEYSQTSEAVLFMNGELEAEIVAVEPQSIILSFRNDGILRQNAHISIGKRSYNRHYLSEYEKSLILLAQEYNVAYIALSMARCGDDVSLVRDFLYQSELKQLPMITVKFETSASIENIDSILAIGDAFFVARGDLGLALDPETIPTIQKEIVKRCRRVNKPVFLATQILSTMQHSPYPLRAEISDLANAIMEGCSAITLSEETAIGKYPLQCIETASRIIHKTLNPPRFPESRNYDIEDQFWDSKIGMQLFSNLQEIGERLWLAGMAEANAGNLSINVTSFLKAQSIRTDDCQYYIVSRSGTRYRQYKEHNPKDIFTLVKDCNDNEEILSDIGRPTSEWDTHLGLHRELLRTKRTEKIILHAHPANIIALSALEGFGEQMIKRLYAILPEMRFYIPDAIALCPYALPGSKELAELSVKALQDNKVIIWEAHGVLCIADTLDTAFDYMEILNKAAGILLSIR